MQMSPKRSANSGKLDEEDGDKEARGETRHTQNGKW